MQAVIYEQFGEPAEVLRLREVDPPVPGRGEVLVRMLCSPVNPSDLMTVRGMYGKQQRLPATPGYEGTGIVEAAGPGLLGRLIRGKRVAVLNSKGGNWAERVVIPAKQAIPLPADLPVEQAAMFFVNPASAYVMTREVLRIPRGAWLLQSAAGSALGRMVIRLGKRYGFRTLNVVRRAAHVEPLRQLGADRVLVFDPQREEAAAFVREVRDSTGGAGVKYAIDPVGGETGSAIVDCLGEEGRMLVYGTLSNAPLTFSPRKLMGPGARIEGFWLSRFMLSLGLPGKLRLVGRIKSLMRAGILVSEPGKSYPLDQIAEAVRESEREGRDGKVLLQCSRAV